MKKFIGKSLLLIATVIGIGALYLHLSPSVISKTEGPSTRAQIAQSVKGAKERNYELLLLGNSRVYRGLNPDKFNISTYNFAHDNDSYNQMYYKIRYLLEDYKKKIKYIVLGVDYFSFSFLSDSRNYVYSNIFGKAYQADYDTVKNYLDQKNQMNQKANDFLSLRFSMTFPIFLSNLKYLAKAPPANIPFLKENGQYIKPGKALPGDKGSHKQIILDIQKKYFEKIIDYCKEKGIRLFLIMPPSRENQLKNFGVADRENFDNWMLTFVGNGAERYDNFSKDSGYTIDDFTDITHLNEKAADRFSIRVNNIINEYIKN